MTVRPTGRSTFVDAAYAFLDQYDVPRTKTSYKHAIDSFLRWCDGRGLDPTSLKPIHFEVYKSEISATLQPATVRLRQQGVIQLFRYMVKHQVYRTSPIPEDWSLRLGYPDSDPSTLLSESQFAQFMAAADRLGGQAGVAARLIADVGMRSGELAAARVEDVTHDAGGATIIIRSVHGAPSAECRIARAVAEGLREIVGDRPAGPLLMTRTGSAADQKAIQRLLEAVRAEAGVELHVTPKTLVNAAIRHGVRSGVNARVVAAQYRIKRPSRARARLADVLEAENAGPDAAPAEFALELVALSRSLLAEPGAEPGAGAVLSSAALEFFLRKMCERANLHASTSHSIDKQANALKSKGIVGRLDWQQIATWRDIRNFAVHGDFAAVPMLAATQFNDGLADFVERYRLFALPAG